MTENIINTFLGKEDLLQLICEHGGDTNGLDLSGKGTRKFKDNSDLSGMNLIGVLFNNTHLFRAKFDGSNLDLSSFQNAQLEYATFKSHGNTITLLKGARFNNAHLEYADFQKADLTGALFCSNNENIGLPPAHIENTDFRGAVLFLADFTGCYFYGTKLEGAFIRGANIFDAHLEEADWGNYIIGEETKPDELHFAESYYRQLKNWYTKAGLYEIAAKFYYREREARRKQLRIFSKDWRHRLSMEVTRFLFGYGEDWKRVVLWMLVVILGSTILYSALGDMDFMYALYYSVVSFTALGYGGWVQITPPGWMQTLGAIESFLGVFLMALALVTFVRKWAR